MINPVRWAILSILSLLTSCSRNRSSSTPSPIAAFVSFKFISTTQEINLYIAWRHTLNLPQKKSERITSSNVCGGCWVLRKEKQDSRQPMKQAIRFPKKSKPLAWDRHEVPPSAPIDYQKDGPFKIGQATKLPKHFEEVVPSVCEKDGGVTPPSITTALQSGTAAPFVWEPLIVDPGTRYGVTDWDPARFRLSLHTYSDVHSIFQPITITKH